MEKSQYPKVLITSIGRINAADSSNNGMLLRNLFSSWPKRNIAQIFSSDDNGDEGFLRHYYQLGPRERRMGALFYKLKAGVHATDHQKTDLGGLNRNRSSSTRIKAVLLRYFVDTGLYELVFRPKLSTQLLRWVREFKPDIIFAQGYCLTFTWLPVMLAEVLRSRVAFFCSDDWPTYIYTGFLGEPTMFSWFMRKVSLAAVNRLMDRVDIPFAFCEPMAREYRTRYARHFVTLSHADDPERFDRAEPIRIHAAEVFCILAAGYFNKHRWPLLLDANECCCRLNTHGFRARIVVLSSGIAPEGRAALEEAQFIDIVEDPGNDLLPGYLKGADLLFLAEGFDQGFVSAIRLSVSSKAHLFMFSKRPVIVYAHPQTGVSQYAMQYAWAKVVDKRDVDCLHEAIHSLLGNTDERRRLLSNADTVATRFHLRDANQALFRSSLSY